MLSVCMPPQMHDVRIVLHTIRHLQEYPLAIGILMLDYGGGVKVLA